MFVFRLIRTSVIDRYCLNSCGLGDRMLFDSRNHLSVLFIIFSRGLHMQLVKVIGL